MANPVRISTFGTPAVRFYEGAKKLGQEAVDAMLAHWRAQLALVLPEKPDLIVVPEACDRFPDHNNEERFEYYKIRGDQVRDAFAAAAKEHGCYIAYSAARALEDGSWRNSTQLIDRNGKVAGIYNKNHLVIEERTRWGMLYGAEAPVFQCDFGRVACAICFDLNFDELRLKYVAQRPDLIVFSSMYHGGLMQAYWAYSCRAHFVGACSGLPSAILSPAGEILATTTNYFSCVTATVNLDCALIHLDYNWDKIRAMTDKYGPKVKLHDPGLLGAVLISSETTEFTISDMIKEFGIELLDDYFRRALDHRHAPGNIEGTA
ncbi:MAG TPA: carbon-nitrogen hydrolase family protein [Candidatus Hydrogenedentes bacterium]|nr:carbon-nitrogen hydrolase family protein [Candidatus Hydrogenedentota bacterium]